MEKQAPFIKDRQYRKFCSYGFLKNLRFFDAFLILFLVEKGLPYTEIGILYATREIIINIVEIPSGIFADTYGRKNALIGSFIAYIVSFIVFYCSNHFIVFLLAFGLYAIGDAFRSGTHKGMIMDYLKLNSWSDQKINYYGHTRAWSQRGSALSSLFAGFIVFYSGSYQSIFLYAIVPYVLNLLLIFSYPQELNMSSKGPKGKKLVGIKKTFQSFLTIIKRKKVFGIMTTSAVFSAYLSAVKDYIQPLMVHVAALIPVLLSYETTKKNGVIIGVIYFFIYLLSSIASQLASRVADGNQKTISNTTLILGLSAGLICGFFFHYGLWVLALIAFMCIYWIENLRKPILTGFIANQVPNEILTSVISAQSQLKTLMTATIAVLFGLIADIYGIGISFLSISAVLLFIVILIKSTSTK